MDKREWIGASDRRVLSRNTRTGGGSKRTSQREGANSIMYRRVVLRACAARLRPTTATSNGHDTRRRKKEMDGSTHKAAACWAMTCRRGWGGMGDFCVFLGCSDRQQTRPSLGVGEGDLLARSLVRGKVYGADSRGKLAVLSWPTPSVLPLLIFPPSNAGCG